MKLFPAMDLFDGNVVKLEAGKHREVERVYGRPGEIADRWLGLGAEWLHVVDLNATLEKGDPNVAAVEEILPRARRSGARVQWGGGVRDDAALARILDAGVDRAIVGTKAVKDWGWLVGAAARFPDRIMIAVDAMGLEVMVKGWQEASGVGVVDLLRRAEGVRIAGFLYTNVKVEGRGQGVDWAPVGTVVRESKKPVVFSGGVTTIDDVARFKELGAYGIILGSALYLNRIDFSQARALVTS